MSPIGAVIPKCHMMLLSLVWAQKALLRILGPFRYVHKVIDSLVLVLVLVLAKLSRSICHVNPLFHTWSIPCVIASHSKMVTKSFPVFLLISHTLQAQNLMFSHGWVRMADWQHPIFTRDRIVFGEFLTGRTLKDRIQGGRKTKGMKNYPGSGA